MPSLADLSFTILFKGEEKKKISVSHSVVHRPHASELPKMLSKNADL